MIRNAFLLIALIMLTACQSDHDAPENDSGPAPSNLTIEVYSTGGTPVAEVEKHLMALFPFGKIRALPDDRIAVAAPAPQQYSIGALIEQLSANGSTAARQVQVRQWLVEGTPAEQTGVPDNLAALEKQLLATAELAGPMTFQRLELVQFQLLDDRITKVGGNLMNLTVGAQIHADTIELTTKAYIRSLDHSLETDMALTSGAPVVMGLVENKDRGSMLLFIVQAEIL